jgi:hypothetical protein
VANTSGATVISLQSHPAWIAAQEHARQRSEAMRRHPAFLARKLAAQGADRAVGVRNFTVYSGADTPA